jgi:hypothetical protein
VTARDATGVEVDVAAIRAREAAATPGPWLAHDGNLDYDPRPFWVISQETEQEDSVAEVHVGFREDAEFIAHARTDIPALLADRDRLAAELEQMRYERRLLGFSRRLLDECAEHPGLGSTIRRDAADLAQRIVDEIGHPVTDEDALGPDLRAENARVAAELEEGSKPTK